MNPSKFLAAFLFVVPASAMVVAPATVQAGDTDMGAKVLAQLDKKAETFADTSYTATMDIYKGDTKKKTLEFDMVMKGLEKQYIKFNAPGDVAGMKVLMNGADIWMYNTEFKKVRRIAAHAQRQGFFGADFTPEDMAQAKMADKFDAEVSGKKGSKTTLTLKPKSGVDASFSKMEIVIDATKGGVTKLSYFDSNGKVTRVQSREKWVKVKGASMPTRITMKNLKAGSKTIINLSNVKVDQGVEDSLFSRRTLLR